MTDPQPTPKALEAFDTALAEWIKRQEFEVTLSTAQMDSLHYAGALALDDFAAAAINTRSQSLTLAFEAGFKRGYDMAIEKLRSEVERAVSSNCEIMAAYYTEAADWLDANRPDEAKR